MADYIQIKTSIIRWACNRIGSLYSELSASKDFKRLSNEKDGAEYLTDEAFNKFVRGGELYSLRKNGTWREVGIPTRESCCIVTFGHANPHLDPDF